MTKEFLTKKLHTEIPLSRFMEVEVTILNDSVVELSANLEPNHNHMGTAFGGSLTCLMLLAAYSQIFKLIEAKGHVVVKSSAMEFKVPVKETLRAVCKAPPPEKVAEFLKIYKQKGRARLELESSILLGDGTLACSMKSEFVGL